MSLWRLVTASFFLFAITLGAAKADSIVINGWTPPQNPQVGSSLDFFGTVATGGTDTISYVTFDWGDGSASAGAVLNPGSTSSEIEGTHTYSLAGTYTIAVTATDSGGESQTLAVPFQIPSGVPEPAPVWLLSTGLIGGIGALRRKFPK